MDQVCLECETSCAGEAKVKCRGPCGGTFHAACVQEAEGAAYICQTCALKVVRCCKCKEFELGACGSFASV